MIQFLKRKETFLLILILLLAAFMRLYRISDYMTFLGDEGRDALVAKGILEGHFTLLGPRSSAGDFFMGPSYYYMITPFLWLFRMDPVGPAVMVALFGVATVFLIYYVGKRFFGETAGLFAAAMYAVSPLVLTYSHSSWNPDVVPFFVLLLMYVLTQGVYFASSWKHFLFAGFLLGVLMQLHYLALFLLVISVVYVFVTEWYLERGIHIRRLAIQYLNLFIGFVVGLSPFLAFEARHGFPNTKTIFSFIFGSVFHTGAATNEVHTPFFSILGDVFFRTFARLVFDFPTPDRYHLIPLLTLQLWGLAIVLIAIASIVGLFLIKNKSVVFLLSFWLFLSILFFGFYHKTIYDYLFVIVFPLPFLLIGNLFSQLCTLPKKRFVGITFAVILFLGIFIFNLSDMPFRNEPNRQKNQTETIAKFILSEAGNQPYNFALLSAGNSDHAYRYYLEILGHPPVTIENPAVDPQRKTVTQQLLIVCEDTGCKPLGNSLWEVAGFGQAAIYKSWNVSVVKVYKLVHVSTH